MSTVLDNQNQLHLDSGEALSLTCPHCHVYSEQRLIAVPDFALLSSHRPRQVGMVFECASCHHHVFLRFAARVYAATRIELAAQYSEVERVPEKFSFTYLPSEVATLFREALACHAQSLHNAFALMCRRTMQALYADLGEAGRLRAFNQLQEVREMTGLDPALVSIVQRILFDTDADPRPPLLDGLQSGILLEVVKDLLYQNYIRRGRLQAAMHVRRFLSEERSPQEDLSGQAQ
ncbi:MAG TPA: hypothetical protein VMI92_11825 [Steroidobacteraceae bacterium]|nr:hypothetical protein [Steroidobacteraceae bacterium]